MEKIEAGEPGEVGIEGDEASAAGDGEGREVGIRPQAVGQRGCGGQGLEMSFQICGFGQK